MRCYSAVRADARLARHGVIKAEYERLADRVCRRHDRTSDPGVRTQCRVALRTLIRKLDDLAIDADPLRIRLIALGYVDDVRLAGCRPYRSIQRPVW